MLTQFPDLVNARPEDRAYLYQSFVLGKVMESLMSLPKQEEPKRHFYSTEFCYRCRYNLRQNNPATWATMTGCPCCHLSFVE